MSGVQIAQVHTSNPANVAISQLLKIPPQIQSLTDFHKEQGKDSKLQNILNYLNKGLLPDNSQEAKKIDAQASQFAIVQDVLYFIEASRQNPRRAAVPGHLQEQIMAEIHGGIMSDHFSGDRLYKS